MHKFEMPADYVARVVARQGHEFTCERFDAAKTALIVIDMQHYFMSPPYPSACATAQAIVPNINRIARTLRDAGGTVVWVQNLAPWESQQSWSAAFERLTAERAQKRWSAMQRDAHGFELWPGLDVQAGDERIIKRRYSAFIHGSSNLDNVLRDQRIDTLIITGVATNVCCESTARDAMMLNYRTVMVSDGCATQTDAEHAATLGNFYLWFGDVQTTEQIVTRINA